MKFNLTHQHTLDVYTAVSLGLIDGVNRVAALGNRAGINTGVPEDVWTNGGDYPWMSAATALEIVSDNAADASAGTGARTVLVAGLDANFRQVSQTLTMNGTTAVAIPTSLIRINAARVIASGSGKTNTGTLLIRDAGAGTTRGVISAGIGITRQSIYTVPDNHTLAIHSFVFGINRPTATRDASIATFIQSSNGTVILPLELSVAANPYLHDGVPGVMVQSRTDFCLRCMYVSANSTNLTAGWLGMLFDNGKLPA